MSVQIAIEARGVYKGFQIRGQRSRASLRSRLRRPLRTRPGRRLEVLRDISFEIRRGEFFGIVGRNGSGKSTLLKLLASVYGADRGRIRVAGRLGPFLELGVGFNPQLPAYDNVLLNGVMMGLAPEEARARYEEIVEFAELGDYTDLQLKNYSAGMKVRLGFAVMTHVDADVLLIDEVLSVGDAAFQEKCDVVFRRMHEEGRTIVLVTHSMPTVNASCDRAMLIHDGVIDAIGDPEEVSNRYLEVNLHALAGPEGAAPQFAARFADMLADPPVRVEDCWLADASGERCEAIAENEPIELHAVLDILREIDDPGFKLRIDDPQAQALFVGEQLGLGLPTGMTARAGERFHVTVRIENRFAKGRYTIVCVATQRGMDGLPDPAARLKTLGFDVTGEADPEGILTLDHEFTFEREAAEEVARG